MKTDDPLAFLQEIEKPPITSVGPVPEKRPPKRPAKRAWGRLIIGGTIAGGILAAATIWLAMRTAAEADKDAVRLYLREHADSGKIEEVRWWPAKELPKLREKQLAELKEKLDELERDLQARIDKGEGEENFQFRDTRHWRDIRKGWYEGFAKSPPSRVLRVKYRTTDLVDRLHDEYFEIADGKASPAAQCYQVESEFPE